MKRASWKPYVLFILLTEGVGILSGLLTRQGIEAYSMVEKSALTPPAIVFPIVWTILYALMGVGAARVWLTNPSDARTKGLAFFTFQLIFNFFWSIFFFNRQAYGFSLLWLIVMWVLILLMTVEYAKVDKLAAWLQIPYLVWVAFAGYLNYAVWQLNM